MTKVRSLDHRLVLSIYPCLILDYCEWCDRNIIVIIICFIRIFIILKAACNSGFSEFSFHPIH